jgi:phosphopantothenoylcysteine decarboxylase/phosphopantothenate--cysteine ligase
MSALRHAAMIPSSLKPTSRLRILITAGPTRERIDPIRFISNYSTGTMGYDLAEEASKRGHTVVLVSGPTNLRPPRRVRLISVESALDMDRAVLRNFRAADALIMAAAVCDWRPARISKKKVKRQKTAQGRPSCSKSPFILRLAGNPDIIYKAARRKGRRVVVGFALETEDMLRNAMRKLKEKNLDLIVANKVTKKRDVFGDLKTDVLLIGKDRATKQLRHSSKRKVAKAIIDKVEGLC